MSTQKPFYDSRVLLEKLREQFSPTTPEATLLLLTAGKHTALAAQMARAELVDHIAHLIEQPE